MTTQPDTPETDAMAGMMRTRSEWESLCARLERERNELREKYRMHHAEAERLTKENAMLRKLIEELSPGRFQ